MKKYLLLATTALLVSTNTWAGTPAADGQSITLNATASIYPSSVIVGGEDISFGGFVLPSVYTVPAGTAIASIAANSEVTLLDTTHLKLVTSDTGQVGEFWGNEASSGSTDFVFTCADGTGDPTDGDKCNFSTHFAIGNVSLCGTGDYNEGSNSFSSKVCATLYARTSISATVFEGLNGSDPLEESGPALMITLSY